ncbi:hypothetical protein [Ottowia sp.]|uniref:hypothetical protein n=1 Tax=Ottowia sp. TaxID=1898956 RepID=UPI0025F930C5|nr:hypothetical protein [Ottowia sp.]MBK6616667.1 hypothetical protein [Ottowia sp.]
MNTDAAHATPINLKLLLASRKAQAASFAVVALFGVLLLASPALFYIGVLLGLVLATWYVKAPIDLGGNLDRIAPYTSKYASAIALVIAVGWMAFTATLPLDDLLRHIQAASWGFNYIPHYEHHILDTSWSWTIGFDAVVGAVHSITGDVLITSRIVRAAETLFVGGALLLAINRATSNNALRFLALALALIGMVWPRIQLGRPEVIFTGLVFSACFLRRGWWLALFALLSPAYAFSPIYAAAAVLLGRGDEPFARRLARNALVAVAAVALSFAFWFWYTNGQYTKVYTLLTAVLDVQSSAKLSVGELLPLVAVMAAPICIFIITGLLYVVWRQAAYIGSKPGIRQQIILLLVVAFYFSLPNYVRYAPIIWSLFILAALFAIGDELPPGAPAAWLWISGALFIALNIAPRGETVPTEVLKAMRVPAGSKVLAPFNRASYIAVAANPEAIVTPIFDISAVTQPYRDLVVRLSEGKFDCGTVELPEFDYVMENTLNGNAPPCLSFVASQGSLKLWLVKKATATPKVIGPATAALLPAVP